MIKGFEQYFNADELQSNQIDLEEEKESIKINLPNKTPNIINTHFSLIKKK